MKYPKCVCVCVDVYIYIIYNIYICVCVFLVIYLSIYLIDLIYLFIYLYHICKMYAPKIEVMRAYNSSRCRGADARAEAETTAVLDLAWLRLGP